MAELADAHGSGPCEHCAHEGSSPFSCTGNDNPNLTLWRGKFGFFVVGNYEVITDYKNNMRTRRSKSSKSPMSEGFRKLVQTCPLCFIIE